MPVAYGLMAIFWPWAVLNPLNPLEALRVVSHYPINIDTLFMGQLVQSNNPPALYLPVYLAVKLPEPVLIGAALAVALGTIWLVRGGLGTAAGSAPCASFRWCWLPSCPSSCSC